MFTHLHQHAAYQPIYDGLAANDLRLKISAN